MEYFGETTKLTKILNDPRLRIKMFGQDRAKRIGQRLSDFEDARTLDDISRLPPSRLHLLHGDHENQFAIDVGANWRMIIEGYDYQDKLTIKPSDAITISIIGIEDYH